MTTTDRPRKIVVCNPDDFARVNAAVMALDYGDVLVQPNRHVTAGDAYVMNDPFPIISVFDLPPSVPPGSPGDDNDRGTR